MILSAIKKKCITIETDLYLEETGVYAVVDGKSFLSAFNDDRNICFWYMDHLVEMLTSPYCYEARININDYYSLFGFLSKNEYKNNKILLRATHYNELGKGFEVFVLEEKTNNLEKIV